MTNLTPEEAREWEWRHNTKTIISLQARIAELEKKNATMALENRNYHIAIEVQDQQQARIAELTEQGGLLTEQVMTQDNRITELENKLLLAKAAQRAIDPMYRRVAELEAAIDTLRPVLAQHYQTGDYVPLGIAAQDMLRSLEEK